MSRTAASVKDIFLEALDLPREARSTWVTAKCSGDHALLQQVEMLLQLHEEPDSLLDQSRIEFHVNDPAAGEERLVGSELGCLPTFTHWPITQALGASIGPYKLRELLGEGGFGMVYVAEQEQPIRRKVALKVIKPGMDSKEVIARFEAERQALALMDHPNIAKVHDAGTTDGGHPYFVMELVRGLSITDYCDQAKLSLRERLKLFITVCQAVQHAHQKGIIHRDIKPSNVMITLHDGTPVPKVIDFGVAKALSQRLTEHTIYTRHAQLLGTPMYMSPEQAELSGLDVDTRSDVYSLGVLLYELLTGQTPFDKAEFSKLGYDELRRMIREVEPSRPSQRISTLGHQHLSTVASRHGIDERQLSRTLRGELDWIVMKGLEKDRNRRYESVSAFAADVGRFLNDQPIEACPPSARYRCRKFVRKYRVALGTTVVVAAVLILGTAISVWQAVRAEENAEQARTNLTKAREAVDQMLLRVSDRLKEQPQMEEVRTQLLQDALAFYATFLQEHPDDPELQFEAGKAHRQYGNLQRDLGRLTAAEQTYNAAIHIFHDLAQQNHSNLEYRQELAHSYTQLADALSDSTGRMNDAGSAYRKALDLARQLAIDSPSQYEGWLAERLNNLGGFLQGQGRPGDAEAVHREALAIRRKNPNDYWISETLTYLAALAREKMDGQAESLYREALAVVDKAPPTERQRSDQARLRCNLATELTNKSNFVEAEGLLREAIAYYENLVERSPDTRDRRAELARAYAAIGSVFDEAGKLVEAEEYLRRSLAIRGELSAQYPDVHKYLADEANTRHTLGYVLNASGRYAEAASEFQRAAAILDQLAQQNDTVPIYPVRQCWALWNLSYSLEQLHEPAEQASVLMRCLPIAEKTLRAFPDSKYAQVCCWKSNANLGVAQYRRGEWESAARALQRAFDLEPQLAGWDVGVVFELAIAYARSGDRDSAQKWYDKGVAELSRDPSKDDEDLRVIRHEAETLLRIVGETTPAGADETAARSGEAVSLIDVTAETSAPPAPPISDRRR